MLFHGYFTIIIWHGILKHTLVLQPAWLTISVRKFFLLNILFIFTEAAPVNPLSKCPLCVKLRQVG
jgi:hypothetical protein